MDTRHPDEGTIQAYVEGQLARPELERVHEHVTGCAECAAQVAEARGLVAAAARIVGALDGVPGQVVPVRRQRQLLPPWAAAAAVLLLTVGVLSVSTRQGSGPGERAATAIDAASRPEAEIPALEKQNAAAPPAVAGPPPAGAGSEAQAARPADARETEIRSEREAVRTDIAAGASAINPAAVTAEPVVSAPRVAAAAGDRAAAADMGAAAAPPARDPARWLALEEVAVISSAAAPESERRRTARAAGAAFDAREGMAAPLRTIRYEVSTGVQVELREYSTAGEVPQPQPGQAEYRWQDPGRTRTYVLSGPLSVAELEQLAHRLGDLKIMR